MIRLFAVMALVVLVIGGVCAETAKDVLKAVEDAYWELNTYQDVSASTIKFTDADYKYTLTTNSVLKYKRPRLLSIESKSDKIEGNGTFVFDGDTYWIYRKDLGRYMKAKSLSTQEFGTYVPFADYYTVGLLVPRFTGASKFLDEGLDKLVLVPNQTVDKVKCDLLKGTYKSGWISLWIARDNKMVVKMTGQHRFADGSRLDFYETHKDIRVDATMHPTAFAFAPPASAVMVDSFGGRPGGLGKVDLGGVPNEGALQNGDRCPDFNISGVGGEGATANEQLMGRPVLLSFWSAAVPGGTQTVSNHLSMLQKLAIEMQASGLVVVSVVAGVQADQLKESLGEQQLAFALQTDDGTLFNTFQVGVVPTVYVLNKRGRITGSVVGQGADTEKKLTEILTKAQ